MKDKELTELAIASGGLTVAATFDRDRYEPWYVTLTPATGKTASGFGETLSEAVARALDPSG